MGSKGSDSGSGFIFQGKHVNEQQVAFALKGLLTTLRPGELPLGTLSIADQHWLTTAMVNLIQIDQGRRGVNVHESAHCIFEVDHIYFQCLAPSFGTYLRCESVSEKYLPEIAAVLTPKKRDRLVHEFGFTAPGYSKNFSQKIEIKGTDGLAYVARMAFRVLRDVYDVRDFGATQFKLTVPKPLAPNSELLPPRETGPQSSAEKPYVVFVDDNFHYLEEEERYKSGDYATFEEAVKECKKIVDDFLNDKYEPGMLSDTLFDHYTSFGEDPFIRGPRSEFSAWSYARQRCDQICNSRS